MAKPLPNYSSAVMLPDNTPCSSTLTTSVREVSAELTLQRIQPLLGDIGVTAQIDLTLAGVPACPVFQITRQDMRSDYFNAGKGYSEVESRVSGLMEAVEVYCFERATPCALVSVAQPQQLPLISYSELGIAEAATPPAWLTSGWQLPGGQQCWLPADAVYLTLPQQRSQSASANGIASGNSVTEACCHALFEMFERHALAEFFRAAAATAIERVLPPAHASHLHTTLSQLRNQGISCEFVLISEHAAVAVFICYLDIPLSNDSQSAPRGAVQGFGAHFDPLIAMSRALAEAIQILALCPADIPAAAPAHSAMRVVTSKQAAQIDPVAILHSRRQHWQQLQQIISMTAAVPYDYLSFFDRDDIVSAAQDADQTQQLLLAGLAQMGINQIYVTVLSPAEWPVVVVKCFAPGLACVDGI